MEASDKIKSLFGIYNEEVEEEIKSLLNQQSHFLMYDMMSYFFGFLDENLKPISGYGGKRFRPGLCLMIAQMYDKRKEALEVATAIEIYHNFTLIHDDIEDNDPMRRGRPTVWKVWGINHGVNTGDGQLILASLELSKIATRDAGIFSIISSFLNKVFLEVVEGQFLDFTLADLPLGDKAVSENSYLTMIEKKTSVLVGAAAKSAGIISGVGAEEQEALWEYGVNLGLAFQLQDDLLSIWSDSEPVDKTKANDSYEQKKTLPVLKLYDTSEQTGKLKLNDIYEKKKTLPIIRIYDTMEPSDKIRLMQIYNQKRRLNIEEANKVVNWLNNSDAYDYTNKLIKYHADKARKSVDKLGVKEEDKKKLLEVIEALLPGLK